MYNVNMMQETTKSINTLIQAMTQDNYESVFNDFITVFATNDYLTDLLYKSNIYHAIDLFENQEIENIESYQGYQANKDNTESWFNVDTNNMTLRKINMNDSKMIMSELRQCV